MMSTSQFISYMNSYIFSSPVGVQKSYYCHFDVGVGVGVGVGVTLQSFTTSFFKNSYLSNHWQERFHTWNTII